MVEFTVTHQQTPEDDNHYKWRATTFDGKAFEAGDSTGEKKQAKYSYAVSNTYRIFAWMPCGLQRDAPFYPQEVLPIPTTTNLLRSEEEEEEEVVVDFAFDRRGNCRPSHMGVFITNQSRFTVQVDIENASDQVISGARYREFAFKTPNNLPPTIVVSKSLLEEVTIQVSNGDTILVSEDEQEKLCLSREPLDCPFPIYDVPIRCINRSGEDASVVAEAGYGDTHHCSSRAGEERIIWLRWHPKFIRWTTPSAQTIETYKSGMTLTIRTAKSIESIASLTESGFSQTGEFIELLEEAGELERCANLFCDQYVEFRQLKQLTQHDWDQLKVPVGSRLRIQEQLGKRITNDPSSGETNNAEEQYDLFLSHRHEGGEDLAQAIKLQLQVMFSERKLRVFLDVDNLRDLSKLEKHVHDSKNFLLLLTPGALDRPFIQKEVIAALQSKKNIVVVHDIKNCDFPNQTSLPPEVRPILERIVIPYYRHHSFRDTAIHEIAKAIGLTS